MENAAALEASLTASGRFELLNDARYLPVVVDGKVVGIVSRSDFKGLELDQFEDEQSLWERIC